ncbi:MAG: hypothetical protein O2895_03615 [Chloroflexi bacterium]|nr:hypothetical protein [Chloroflexota bacterium]
MRALGLGLALLLAAGLACTSNQAADPGDGTGAGLATATPVEAAATPSTSEPSAAATPEQRLAIVYVGDTAGTGIGLRDGCHADARIEGAWPDGTAVRIINHGGGACSGWTYVVGPGVGSWVLDDYLTETQPAVAATAPGGSTTTPPQPGPPAGAAMFLFGSGSPGDLVTVSAGGVYCSFARADAAVGLWALEVGPGTDCTPSPGATLSFTRNGQPLQTGATYTFTPGGNVHVQQLQ